MSGDAALRCEGCLAALLPDDQFCERCGARVGAEPPEPARSGADCHACGAPAGAIGEDGCCTVCGAREPGHPDPARTEVDLAAAAAVSDQGRVHHRNEDAFHLELVGEDVVIVLCDGISTSLRADAAARCAATKAGAVLADALRENAPDLEHATLDAVLAAQRAVRELPVAAGLELADPSCTLVSAVCRQGELVIGAVGDSRAYWIAAGDARLLTVDDSWATEQVAGGLLTAKEAAADPRAHAITRWVGTDGPDDPPEIVVLRPDKPGRLVLCSDGLWNYAPGAGELAALLDELPTAASAVAVARSLTDVALARGGHDNITVAVVDVRPQRRSSK